MKRIKILIIAAMICINSTGTLVFSQSIQEIIPERHRVKLMDSWLEWKREHVLPGIMRREGVDLWIVRNNEGPVYLSLLPTDAEGLVLSSPSFLIFYDTGSDNGVERLEGNFADLPNIIKERDPGTIGINVSDEGWRRGDGFSPSDREDLKKAFGRTYASRIVSAANISIEWLTTKAPQEISAYRYVARVARSIIAKALSNDVIVPDVTTTADLNWWLVQKYLDNDFLVVDHPSVSITRSDEEIRKYPESADCFEGRSRIGNGVDIVIRRGDLVGLDSGIKYLGLNTDTKAYAYVLKGGETDAPEGLKQGLRNGNRLQDIFTSAWKIGDTGDEIARRAAKIAEEEGLRPRIYSHPISYFIKRYGRSGLYRTREHFFPGTSFNSHRRDSGSRDSHDLRPRSYYSMSSGNYPLHYDTITSLELSNTSYISEWGRDIEYRLEENVVFSDRGVEYLDARQSKLHIIR
jgi:hypothetical protein